MRGSSYEDVVVLVPLDAAAAHRLLDVLHERIPVLAHLLRSLCTNPNCQHSARSKVVAWGRANAPLFNGSSAFGSRKRYCRPTMTELRFSTGFQSSRRMFRQTLPSKSTFGWYIYMGQHIHKSASIVHGEGELDARSVCT